MEHNNSKLTQLINRRLKNVLGQVFFLNGEFSKFPCPICFFFEDDLKLTVSLDSIGTSIQLNSIEIEAFDMQECGECVIRSYSRKPIFSDCHEEVLQKLFLIHDMKGHFNFGIKLVFERSSIAIINNGDEIYVSNGIPPSICPNEDIFEEELIKKQE